jgi:predicted PurR-regulated permease PerM
MQIPRDRDWRWKPGRGPVVVVTFVTLSLFVALVVLIIIARVASDLSAFEQQLPQYSTSLEQSVAAQVAVVGVPPEFVTQAVQQLQRGLTDLTQVVDTLLGIFGGLLNIIFTIIIAVYLAVDSRHLLTFSVRFLPAGQRAEGEAILSMTGLRLGMWVRGQLVVATIISSLFWVGLTLIGVPYAGLLSVIAFIGEFIPLIGPFISSIPAIFVAFVATTPGQGVATALFCLVVEQLENDYIVPRVMSTATTVHPLAVLLGILAGGQLFGPIGALLAVPIITCVTVIWTSIRAYRAGELHLELETPPELRAHPESTPQLR